MFNLLTLFDSIFNDLFLCKNLRLRGWKNRKIGAGVEKKTEEVFLKGNGNLEVKGFETGGYRRERTECSLNRENTSEPFSYVLSLSPSRNKNLNRIETVWQISSRDIHPPPPSLEMSAAAKPFLAAIRRIPFFFPELAGLFRYKPLDILNIVVIRRANNTSR